jgi:plastocyanin
MFGLTVGLLAAPAWAAERAVSMTGNAYEPARLQAAVGHAVDLGKQEPGQETVLNLGRPGLLEVECVFHHGMVMTVEVRP